MFGGSTGIGNARSSEWVGTQAEAAELAVPTIEPIWFTAEDVEGEEEDSEEDDRGQDQDAPGDNACAAIMLSSSDDDEATAPIKPAVVPAPAQPAAAAAAGSDVDSITFGRRARQRASKLGGGPRSASLEERWAAVSESPVVVLGLPAQAGQCTVS